LHKSNWHNILQHRLPLCFPRHPLFLHLPEPFPRSGLAAANSDDDPARHSDRADALRCGCPVGPGRRRQTTTKFVLIMRHNTMREGLLPGTTRQPESKPEAAPHGNLSAKFVFIMRHNVMKEGLSAEETRRSRLLLPPVPPRRDAFARAEIGRRRPVGGRPSSSVQAH
jgi:hypothetical protein